MSSGKRSRSLLRVLSILLLGLTIIVFLQSSLPGSNTLTKQNFGAHQPADHLEGVQNSYSELYRQGTERLRKRAVAPATDEVLATYAQKGCNLLYLMAVDSQDALARMQQMSRMSAVASSQSIYTSASQLAEYGWTAIQEKITWSQLGLQEVMNSLGIAEDDGKVSPGQHNELWDLTQDEEKTIQGVEYPATSGVYNQILNVTDGLIVMIFMTSPQNEARIWGLNGPIIPLSRASDVVFLAYMSRCSQRSQPISRLRYFIMAKVNNDLSQSLIYKALALNQAGRPTLTPWPGVEFDMNTIAGRAILASPNGAMLSWMLIQHKQQFGTALKSVARVKVFESGPDAPSAYPNLIFYIEDAPTVHDFCEGEGQCCCQYR